MTFRPRSIRFRLTLWYTGTLAVVIALFGIAVYGLVRTGLVAQMDSDITGMCKLLKWTLRYEPDEAPEFVTHAGDVVLRAKDALGQDFVSPGWRTRNLEDALPISKPTDHQWHWIRAKGRLLRMYTFNGEYEGALIQLALGKDAEFLSESLEHVRNAFLLVLPLALILAALGGWLLAGRLLAPVGAIAVKASAISAERLGERLPVENPEDEIGRLTVVLNSMLGRLEDSFQQMRRFISDASHELRTPLTSMRSMGEATIMGPDDPALLREAIAEMLEETQRLRRLVDALLLLARADAGQIPLNRERFSLPELVRESVEIIRVLAEEKGQSFALETSNDVLVEGDRALLQQAILNLLDNAVKFTPCQGSIRVCLREGGEGRLRLEVVDNGPGVPPEHKERIFEGVCRVYMSRVQGVHGGAGLGLAITRLAVDVHEGILM